MGRRRKKAKIEYFKVIAEEENHTTKEKTVAELIAEKSMAKEKERERLSNCKNTTKKEEEAKKKEEDNREDDEQVNNSKKSTSPEDTFKGDLEIEGERVV